MSALPIIMPPNTMNSGIGGRSRVKSLPSKRPSKGCGMIARPATAAPFMLLR